MVKLSNIAAGTMNWGVWGKNLSAKGMANLIELCIECKISTFDHADIYGGYTTEKTFGEAFTQSGVNRQSVQFISKCGIQYVSENRNNKVKHYDYSKEYIIWSVENSLNNLQTEYLDLLLLHRPSPLMNTDEIAEAVEHLKRDGKILDFGLSNFTSQQTELISQKTKVAFNQIEFSVTHLDAMVDGSLDHMMINGIRPMAWNPLGMVFREDTPQITRIKNLLTALESKYEVTSTILLLAWILKHPSKIIPVCGTANPERIRELMKATQIELELEDWFALWIESRGSKVP